MSKHGAEWEPREDSILIHSMKNASKVGKGLFLAQKELKKQGFIRTDGNITARWYKVIRAKVAKESQDVIVKPTKTVLTQSSMKTIDLDLKEKGIKDPSLRLDIVVSLFNKLDDSHKLKFIDRAF